MTLTVDFKLSLAGVAEAVTVTGEAPLIEVTQSKVASSIEATELQNLPLVTRNVSGMLALLPGAVQIEPVHRSKTNVGSVSYGGSAGTNVIPSVDGADNRDNQFGGPLLAYSTEAIEQFQLATSQFNAADGRTGGAALTMVTKSGTNVLHGSAFGFGRSDKMTAKDFFTAEANRDKTPFSRAAVRRIGRRPDPPQPRVLLRRRRADPRGLGACRPREPVQREAAARQRPGGGPDPAGLRQPRPTRPPSRSRRGCC